VSPRTSAFHLPISVHLVCLIRLENDCWSCRALGRHRVTSTSRLLPCCSFPSRTLLNPFSFSRPPTSSVPSLVLPHRSFHSHSLPPLFLSSSLAPSSSLVLSLWSCSCCLRSLRSLLALSFFFIPFLPLSRLGSLSLSPNSSACPCVLQ
jgi:hypothetical protein